MKIMKKIMVSIISTLVLISVAGCQVDTSSVDQKTPVKEEVKKKIEPAKLTRTYTTKFTDVTTITYPKFEFDYSDHWRIKEESASTGLETVVLVNERNVKITYLHLVASKDQRFNNIKTAYPRRIKISKAEDSQFIPSSVQATSYKELGKFMVAKLKVVAESESTSEEKYKEVDGNVSYAVLPESKEGTVEGIRGIPSLVFSFWYAGHISFTVNSGQEKFTEEDEAEVVRILATFRTKKY